MPPRIHVDVPLVAGTELTLPGAASRHVQVLRLQPGDAITLFDGQGGQWQAEVLAMGRKDVTARLLAHQPLERELHTPVTLALGMPANERMDALVEKATELGVATIVPLVCERSVLRLAGERAERRSAHWQAIAVAACEQSGRNRVPQVLPPQPLRAWLAGQPLSLPASLPAEGLRLVLSLADDTQPLRQRLAAHGGGPVSLLSGPEGGLSPAELAAAAAAGHLPTTLGARVLRADTAPLAALAVIAALESPP
ncbi:16S rRNA (uracil(1498)-N(3))-methyltransferase [Pseudaquabacterium pictum]|uniref:Ribosomal RNA small subunit methyltransferase E n=1 Tax=Pseudaquabacterium pictum TaxID=2315236 RepID=A0A480ASS2_9BURK|nr:16S rRNA (uracil(1498)-N(3))-methyltransferase [Rubrivivax pictus]GCL64574.1 ribosomal RNA small subunit methyltransferase E [Rubrivivax pictus]